MRRVVGAYVRRVVERWARYLREEKGLGNEDPLFPATDAK
jgi:hypothetical protein